MNCNYKVNMTDIQTKYKFKIFATRGEKGEQGDVSLEQLNAVKNQLQNEINSLSNGSPLVASSTSGMTDTTKVYVNTTDGYWYYYDGSNWTQGGVYQSTGIADESIYLRHLNNDVIGNKYHYNATRSYPNILFQLPSTMNTNTITSIGLKAKFKNVGATFSNPHVGLNLVQPGWWNSRKNFTEFNFTVIENDKYYTLDLKLDELSYGNHNFKQIGIEFATSSSKAYEFYFEDVEIYLNNEKVKGLTLVTSTYYEDSSENITYLATKKYVDSMRAELENIKNYDALSKSSLLNITCWGDSITEGGASDGLPYPQYLQNLLGNKINVNNKGGSGQCSGTVAFRQGGNVVTTGESFTIPASNEDSVSFQITPTNPNMNARVPCVINGVTGNITFANDNSASFQRTTSGETVSVETGTQLSSPQAIYDDNLVIIWVGRNDMAFSWPHQIDGPIANIKSMIDRLTPTIKRFLVISCTTTTNEVEGGQSYGWVMELNEKLAEAYPNNFVNIENYLVNQCIYDAGITPTADDIEKMEGGTIPPSLMFDFVHPNVIARQYIAQYIYNVMLSKDWIR